MARSAGPNGLITRWLERASALPFMLYASGAAFCTYFCMYGYRKAFAAAQFEGETIGGSAFDLKSALVIGQVVGYALSKFIGIRFLAALEPSRRVPVLLAAIGSAELALVLFGAFSESGWLQVVALFFNGLPLGIVWGLVFSFLEGRRTSDVLGAALCCSFILASGVAKTIGAALMERGVTESWMPAAAGVVYLPFFLVSVFLLSRLPPPSEEDRAERVERQPMSTREQLGFMRRYFVGMMFLLLLYLFLTAYRDFRDNFAADVFQDLQERVEAEVGAELATLPLDDQARPALEAEIEAAREKYSDTTIFAKTELPIALIVLGCMALLFLVKNSRRAFLWTHAMMAAGTVLVGGSTLLFDTGTIDGVFWMILVGLGLYLAYVPYNCVLFDRMIPAMGAVGNAVFGIYVADSVGYVGVIGVVLYKNFIEAGIDYLEFFRAFSYFTAVLCTVSYIASGLWFARQPRPDREDSAQDVPSRAGGSTEGESANER